MAAAPIATAVGSPVSAALLEMNGALGLGGWQWMFLIEAAPAIVLGGVTWVYMTDRPADARWLSEDQRAWLVAAMAAEAAQRAGHARHSPWRGLVDPRVLVLSLVYFGTSAGLYTLGVWAPQILQQLAASPMTVGVLNTIPPAVSVVAMVMWGRHSDRSGERVRHVASACLLAAVGLVMAGRSGASLGLVVIALTLVNIGISCAKPPLWSMPALFLSGSAAAAGIATINSLGNLGGFVGPSMIGWIKQQTGSFAGGLYFVAGLLVVSAIATLLVARGANGGHRPGPLHPVEVNDA
jgi:ACS family tartrate transporter-like MFS transporter